MEKETEKALENLVRVGTVTDVDNSQHRVRVKFRDMDMTSGWLKVLDTRPSIPDYGVSQRTEYASGGSGEAAFASHKHDLTIHQWMPKVNDTVLTLYLPVFNADGFVLGKL